MKIIKNIVISLILITSPRLVYADKFLPDTIAFQAIATAKENKTIEVIWLIEPGYHMYKNSLNFSSEGKILLNNPLLPKGKVEYNKAIGKTLEQYSEQIVITIPYIGKGNFKLHVMGQGCADTGSCYAPFERIIDIVPKK